MDEEQALDTLNFYKEKGSASLILITGDKKKREDLISKFIGNEPNFVFKANPQTTLKDFADCYFNWIGNKTILPKNWMDMFFHMKVVQLIPDIKIIFDEASYLEFADSMFIPSLKYAWDNIFSENPDLILILGCTDETWMRERVSFNPAFVGRISQLIRLEKT